MKNAKCSISGHKIVNKLAEDKTRLYAKSCERCGTPVMSNSFLKSKTPPPNSTKSEIAEWKRYSSNQENQFRKKHSN